MNISYNWLGELIHTNLPPRELAERLTMLGLAVEGVSDAGDDSILDIDVTSNRPDCLSHVGVAREVAAMQSDYVRLPAAVIEGAAGLAEEFTSVEIQDTDLCQRYAARVVRGVKIQPSPDWLAARLKAIGQRPINNVADITNYVLHEMGQPLHAFDLKKLAEHKIIVRRARLGEKLTTLDGIERELDSEMLVIADAINAVALAGIMGGEESEISGSTTDVLIESAYFSPASVRRTARKLGMHTEASHRFERGVDPANVLRAQERCVALICELAGGTATENALDIYPHLIRETFVSLRPERVETITGLQLTSTEIERILIGLGFSECERGTSAEKEWSLRDGVIEEIPDQLHSKMTFVVPSWRVDVQVEEDLVEEVARHTGYDKIATLLPASSVAGEYQPSERRKRAMTSSLTALGFSEAVSFSFIEASHDGVFELLPVLECQTDSNSEPVTLQNPIIEGANRMRPTLLVGLLNALRHNFNRGRTDIRLFEMGRVFRASTTRGELPFECESLALVATGGAMEENIAGAPRQLDFLDLKGAVESASDSMSLAPLRFAPAAARHLRPGQASVIALSDGTPIGYMGRLAEAVGEDFKFRQPVYVAELDLSRLLTTLGAEVLYKPLARFPSVGRDVSLLVSRNATFAELRQTVLDAQVDLCRGAELVDVYEGANLPADKRSITLRLQYTADDRTLTDEEVDEMHQKIVATLEEKFDAQLRV